VTVDDDTERLREIATSILERAHDDSTASKAGELLKLASEIENQRAEAQKLKVEEQKISLEVKESRQPKSFDWKAFIALLAPVVTTLVLAVTLVVQSYQFNRSEKNKADAAEEMRWTEAI
jgi:hypothetical protein